MNDSLIAVIHCFCALFAIPSTPTRLKFCPDKRRDSTRTRPDEPSFNRDQVASSSSY